MQHIMQCNEAHSRNEGHSFHCQLQDLFIFEDKIIRNSPSRCEEKKNDHSYKRHKKRLWTYRHPWKNRHQHHGPTTSWTCEIIRTTPQWRNITSLRWLWEEENPCKMWWTWYFRCTNPWLTRGTLRRPRDGRQTKVAVCQSASLRQWHVDGHWRCAATCWKHCCRTSDRLIYIAI